MNSKYGTGNYKILNNKAPKKVTRHTTSTEERENFLLDCIMLYSQNRTCIHLVLLVSSLPIEVKVKEQLEKLVQASLANQESQKTYVLKVISLVFYHHKINSKDRGNVPRGKTHITRHCDPKHWKACPQHQIQGKATPSLAQYCLQIR